MKAFALLRLLGTVAFVGVVSVICIEDTLFKDPPPPRSPGKRRRTGKKPLFRKAGVIVTR